MITRKEWIAKHYPDIHTHAMPDYARVAYLEYCVSDLSIQLKGLRDTIDELLLKLYPPPAPLVEPVAIAWPESPKVCTCEKFSGEDWNCDVCGGGRF